LHNNLESMPKAQKKNQKNNKKHTKSNEKYKKKNNDAKYKNKSKFIAKQGKLNHYRDKFENKNKNHKPKNDLFLSSQAKKSGFEAKVTHK